MNDDSKGNYAAVNGLEMYYEIRGEGEPLILLHGGVGAIVRQGDSVFHTYSVYARGLETVGGSYYFLDETALGRQEDWEEPKGRAEDARGAVPDFSS
jgi:predicted dithiol-disulfide oxidoreductase (DUF899 family)